MGTANSGHYYSLRKVKDESNPIKWLEFNDKIVKDFSISKLAGVAFGGDQVGYINKN